MTHRFSAWLHAGLTTLVAAVVARLRIAPERGQGTVEYVALIILVAGVLALGISAAGTGGFNFKEIVGGELKDAIKEVSK